MGAFSGGFCTPRRGEEPYRIGPTWVAIAPFTERERWVLEDALPTEVRERLQRERGDAPKMLVTHVNYENKTITMEAE